MSDLRAEIMPDPAPPWEWYRELADGGLPPTMAELRRPYRPVPGAVDVLAGCYGDPLLDAPDDF